MIYSNLIINNTNGLVLQEKSNHNIISNNIIKENRLCGVIVLYISEICSNNLFFKNKFVRNAEHVLDVGGFNNWNNTEIGNFWDNYTGIDSDDDGIGDKPYIFANGIDYLPIWRTAPNITIISPKPNQIFGNETIDFELIIIDGSFNTSWYSVNNGLNYTFVGNYGKINQSVWDLCKNGTVNICFYANDTLGNIGSSQIIIRKSIYAPTIIFEFSNTYLNTTTPEYFHKGLEVSCRIKNITSLNWVFLCDNSSGYMVNRSMIKDPDDYWKYTIDISSLSWGQEIVFSFYVKNSLGYIAKNDNFSHFYTINIYDFQIPISNISFIPDSENNIVNKSTIFSIMADDMGGSGILQINYKINNSDWDKYLEPFTLSNLNPGTYNISYYSIDNAGNIEEIHTITIILIEDQEPSPPDEPPPDEPPEEPTDKPPDQPHDQQPSISGYNFLLVLLCLSLIVLILYKKGRKQNREI